MRLFSRCRLKQDRKIRLVTTSRQGRHWHSERMGTQLLRVIGMCMVMALAGLPVRAGEEALPKVGDHTFHIIYPNVLELIYINTKNPDPARVTTWDLVDTN